MKKTTFGEALKEIGFDPECTDFIILCDLLERDEDGDIEVGLEIKGEARYILTGIHKILKQLDPDQAMAICVAYAASFREQMLKDGILWECDESTIN